MDVTGDTHDRETVVMQLRAALPDGAVVADADRLESFRRDEARLVAAGRLSCAVLPRSTAQVQEVVRIAGRAGVPVVPRGAGTGLAGGANAVDGAIGLVLTRMDRILEIDDRDLLARVEPGVLNATLSAEARERGLWYPPDPASQDISTIGGNIATNAGGLCCVKYGVTRDFVLGLEVVLADGRAVRLGRRTVKGVAGYDLVGLIVGSEGTLGIVTEATLRLLPAPAAGTTVVATFDRLPVAGDAVAAITRSCVPSLLEILDGTTIRAVDDHTRMGLDRDAAALLLAQSDAGGDHAAAEADAMAAACERAGAGMVLRSTDPAEADLLLNARRLAFPALERLGDVLLDDVAVPRARIPDLLAGVERIAEEHDVVIGTFGHAGDGNMHPTVVFDRHDDVQRRAAGRAFDQVVALALELGGTVTGEHGVGRLKVAHLAGELGEDVLDLHGRVKTAFDPQGILNPGAALGPARPRRAAVGSVPEVEETP